MKPGTKSKRRKATQIDRNIARLLADGYKETEIYVTASGRVLLEPEAKALEIYNKVFHPEKL
ncbi:hypothetical protein BH10CYA1_BH10CYA1_53340 [soil metagenome]